MMKTSPYLSVVIPAYNEERNIRAGVLNGVTDFLSRRAVRYEILFVDDGSTDDTKKLLTAYSHDNKNIRVISTDHQGKAGAVTKGVLQSSGDIILFTDFDQATPIQELDKLLHHLESYDVVIGSRKDRRKGAPVSRIIMARGFIAARRLLLGLDIQDTQCGFKAFKRDVAHKLFRRLDRYRAHKHVYGSSVTAAFDVELLYLASKQGYRIKEVPVAWNYVETRRVNPLRDSWEGLIGLFRIKMNEMKGKYETRHT